MTGTAADQPLRVAVDALPRLVPGGIGMFVTHLMAGLAQRPDVEVHPWVASFRGRRRATALGVRPRWVPMAARPLHAAWRRLEGPPLEWWTGPVDVAHGTNYVLPPTRRAAGVVSIHDLTPWRFAELANQHTLTYPALVERARRRGAWVHTDSDAVRAEVVAELGFPEDRVVTVHLGVPEIPAADPTLGRRLAGNRPYVLALGTVEPRKNLPGLVRAFDAVADQLPDVVLVIAGADGWGASMVDEAIERAAHRRRIVRLRRVGTRERAALLRGARVLAYPSIYEGFGFPPLEAMAVDVPVVTTATGSLPEVVGDAAVLVAPRDEVGLAGALVRAVTDDALRADLVAKGRQRVAHFGWDRCVSGLVDLYWRVAAAG